MRIAVALLFLIPAWSGCLSDDGIGAGTQPPVATVDRPDLLPETMAAPVLAELQAFAETYSHRRDNTPDHVGARDWIAGQFDGAGLEVWRQNFTTDIDQENIVGIKWGAEPNKWVVVGAHYDMVVTSSTGPARPALTERSQGAYDDGSGTMMTVHLASMWAQLETQYTLAFVAFDGEERGLEGSAAFAETVAAGESPYGDVEFVGMLDLDMIGLNWPGVDAPMYFDTNDDALKAAAEEARTQMGMPDDMIKYQGISLGRSDYHWFIELGVPTAFMISNFEEWQLPGDLPITTPPSNQAYPFWHIEDTYDTMLLMAGSQEDLEAGFQAALDIATQVLAQMAFQTTDASNELA